MNTRTNKIILLITLMVCLATAVYSAVGTFTFRTSGASDTTEVVDLRYPQKVPEDASVTTDSIADGSVTNAKLAEPVSVANGGTGKTTAAEALAALGGMDTSGLTASSPCVVVEGATAFTVPDTATTVATYTSVLFTNGANLIATSTGEFTCPTDGIYLAWGKITWDNSTTGTRVLTIVAGTTQYASSGIQAFNSSTYPVQTASCFFWASAGTTIKLTVYQESGAPLDIIGQANPTQFGVMRIRQVH